MTLRDLSSEEVSKLQSRCRLDFVAARSSLLDITFSQYEKIWSGGLRAGLAHPGSKLRPKDWLLSGGGGFEDGEDGIRAANFTGEGLLDMLQAYREYLIGK